MAAIDISGLVKTFGHVRALDGLDLTVETGEVHGFLGPNGAGKSTTIRVLLGLLRADAGEVRLLGGDPWSDAVSLHRRLAYVPGDVSLAILRMRSEETSGRLEPLVATALARPRWAAGYVAVAAAGTVLILAASGLGAGIADAANTGDLVRLPELVGSSVALAPAVWVLIGVAVALFGLVPRAALAAWGALAACYLAAFLGPLLGLPEWVMDVSPFTHVPLLPAASVDVVPLLVLTAVAAALVAVGLVGLRRRDVPA